jgi:hypothetical protein
MSFAAVLLVAPIGTAALFAIIDLLKPPAGGVSPIVSPAGLPALAGTMLSFCALAIIVALNMSLKVRGTVSAVMATVAIVGVVGMGGSACGMGMRSVYAVGPLVAMASPYVTIYMVVRPAEFAGRNGSQGSWSSMQQMMLAFSLIGCGAFSLVVWGMYRSMVRTFDMIVRRQSR